MDLQVSCIDSNYNRIRYLPCPWCSVTVGQSQWVWHFHVVFHSYFIIIRKIKGEFETPPQIKRKIIELIEVSVSSEMHLKRTQYI